MTEKQPRIGRQLPHYEKVDLRSITAIFSNESTPRYRYTLDMMYANELSEQERDKHAVIILKNPSSADIKMADKTIRTAETAIYKHFVDVKKLTVLNLFAIRGTYASEVADRLCQYGYDDILGSDNNRHFEEIISKCDYVITAWGNNSGIEINAYNKRIQEVRAIIKKHDKPAYRKIPKGNDMYPFHACMWGYEEGFIRVQSF